MHLRKSAVSVFNDYREKYEEMLAVSVEQNLEAILKCVQRKKALQKVTLVLAGGRGVLEIVEDSQLVE